MAIAITNRTRFILLAAAYTTTFLVMVIYKPKNDNYQTMERHSIVLLQRAAKKQPQPNWRGQSQNETNKLSALGRILFLEENPPKPRGPENPKQKYQILLWKYGKSLENRHLKHFGDKIIDPFEGCSVRNCEITYEDAAFKTADMVIFHLYGMKKQDLPERGSQAQIWAFFTDESPHHTFLHKNNLTNYNSLFNWSMTYRTDSDIPVPYGRTVLRKTPLEENLIINKRKDVLVSILSTHCSGRNKRWYYVKELKKYINVDIYGGCGTIKACPGHFKADCPDINNYLFYLAFENSNCDEYITEKLWWNAYEKNSIPIVMGATKENYEKLLPPNSYLNIDDYAHPKDLAAHILYLNNTGKYREFYKWKRDFQVLNEHGYFRSKTYHYCRACEALNYNDRKTKIYQNLSMFWSVSRDCHPAWNA